MKCCWTVGKEVDNKKSRKLPDVNYIVHHVSELGYTYYTPVIILTNTAKWSTILMLFKMLFKFLMLQF